MQFMKTGIDNIDKYFGGLPYGRLTEICGGIDVGKTKLIFNIIDYLSQDNIVAYICTSKNSVVYIKSHNFNKNNVIIFESNDADTIIKYIRESMKIVDAYFIDDMTSIKTKEEDTNFQVNQYQNLPSLLAKLYSSIYGEKSTMTLINTIRIKDDVMVPRWDNMFSKYCSLRFIFDEYKKLILYEDKIII